MLLKRHGAAATMNDTEKAERDILGALHSPDGTRRWKATALEEDEASEKSERRGEERRRDRNLNPEVIILIGPN